MRELDGDLGAEVWRSCAVFVSEGYHSAAEFFGDDANVSELVEFGHGYGCSVARFEDLAEFEEWDSVFGNVLKLILQN